MPKTKFQTIVFTLIMSFLMVYVMIVYNISLSIGGLTNKVFLMAFGELYILWPIAFLLEFFIVDKLAHKIAFSIVKKNDRPYVITLAISVSIVLIMCPIMSFIATFLFLQPGDELLSSWLQTSVFNFPMAFFWQLSYCGVIVRMIFSFIFKTNNTNV